MYVIDFVVKIYLCCILSVILIIRKILKVEEKHNV